MSQTIKLKRNKTNSATTPSTLLEGEIAVNILDKSLFVGDGNNVVRLYIDSDKYFNSEGYANNALKFGGNGVSHFGTAAQVTAINKSIESINNTKFSINGGVIKGSITPDTNAKYNLGAINTRWGEIYTYRGFFKGAITLDGDESTEALINYTRESANYITIPTASGSSLNICVGEPAIANAALTISASKTVTLRGETIFRGDVYLSDSSSNNDSSVSNKLFFLRRTKDDTYVDYGIYAQTTKGLTIFGSNEGVITDLAYINGSGDLYTSGNITTPNELRMGTLYLPDVDGNSTTYKFYVGNLGSGADTPEGGGGIGKVSIYLGAGTTPYDSDAEGKVVLPPYPTAVTESTVSGWGFTKNTGTYSKPSTGIPKTDLASAVQASLDKANSALQEHQDLSGYQTKITSTNKLAYSLISGTPTSLPASDVYSWAKAATKPTYTKSEVGLGNVTNLAASDYLTALSSNATNAVSITVGGTTKSITAATLKTSLGLGSLAYKNSLVASDIPDLSGTYLPLSGGLMADNAGVRWSSNVHSWDAPVDGFECISTYNEALEYYAGLSYKGYYGLQIRAYGGNTDNIQVRGYDHIAWGTWRTLIHSDNYSSYALPKSGGTIDGNLSIGNTDNTAYKYIRIHRNNKVLEITNTGDYGVLNFSDTAFSFNSNGVYWKGNTLIHSGNIGSYAPIYNSSGNVLIGTTEDSGQKLQIEGDVSISDTSGNPYVKLTNGTYTGYMQLRSTGEVAFGRSAALSVVVAQDGTINTNGSIIPNSTAYNLGTSTNRWASVYSHIGNFSDAITLTGTTSATSAIYFSRESGNYIVVPTTGNFRVAIGATSGAATALVIYGNDKRAEFSGNIYASGYRLPTSAPSNPVSGGYYLYVGSLGAGATIS